MNEYMLLTSYPLYSHKSHHKTWKEVLLKIEDVLKLTEEYYVLQGKEFDLKPSAYSGDYPGIIVYKIWPEKPHAVKVIGMQKPYKKPEEINGLDFS